VLSVVDAYADAIGDFGTSLDGLLQITHNAIKDRTAERQRVRFFCCFNLKEFTNHSFDVHRW
jgi:hypothetical protein